MNSTPITNPSKSILGITGTGLITSVGHDALTTFSSLRCDLTHMQEVKIPAQGGIPLVGAPIVGCSDTLLRERRLWDLAVKAAHEAINQAGQANLPLDLKAGCVLWTTPHEERTGFFAQSSVDFKQKFLEQLKVHSNIPWHDLPYGHSAGLFAIREATNIIASGKASFCLIGGVDSLLQLRLLRWLENIDRLKTETYTDGLIPGEAAAFIVVESKENIEKRKGEALAFIDGFGSAYEEGSILSDQPCRGQGLTKALRDALDFANTKPENVQSVFCDLNGESYRANEWALANLRVGFSEDIEVSHPADCIGDVGAATGTLLLAYGALHLTKSPLMKNSLIFSCADNGERGAVVLTRLSDTNISNGCMRTKNRNEQVAISKEQNKKITEFATELYQEHLEEASFLYEQRLTLFDDPEINWLDIEDWENRFEPHIDGLVVGEDLALEVCKQQATEGDFGELHAAIRVFCRQNRKEWVEEIIKNLDPEDEESVQAISDALNHELPPDWQGGFIELMSNGERKLTSIVSKLIGYQRIHAGDKLLYALQQNGMDSSVSTIWALGRLREQKARETLFHKYLQQGDDSQKAEAALALLRLGETQTLSVCQTAAKSEDWPFIALGLGGNQSTVPVLLQIAASEKVTSDSLVALGLLGDISAVEILLTQLPNPELAEAASRALNLITGAEIYEETFIPEEVDEDELFEEELEKLKKGEPLYPEGEEPGTTLARLSQKPEEWQSWWEENKSRFDSQIRYRNGKPYAPACLLENLEHKKSPRQVRQLAYEELVIRYDIDFPFETDMFVFEQKQAIAKYAEWVKENGSRFQPGEWYFVGTLQ